MLLPSPDFQNILMTEAVLEHLTQRKRKKSRALLLCQILLTPAPFGRHYYLNFTGGETEVTQLVRA